jgi:aspartyl-tRNA(Asn)/glutamyl-tRNA(Gln) amidotransferase subunit C
MAVTPDDVRHVASLARLGIPEAALAGYVEQLNGILSHMEALQRVPADDAAVPPAESGMPLREDRVAPMPLATPKERFAPKMREGFFLVPRLATHEDAGEES